jgi:hypothetical protein
LQNWGQSPLALILLSSAASRAHAQIGAPNEVGINEKLGAQITLDTVLKDEADHQFHWKPEIIGNLSLRVFAVSNLRLFVDLTKLRISTLSTLSAATGYVVYCRTVNTGMVTASLGVLLLAMGACAMNQAQDSDFDARMNRTRHRPMPAGAML